MLKRSYIETHENHPHYFTDKEIYQYQKDLKSTLIDKLVFTQIKTLADSTKVRIYYLLSRVKEMSVSDIAYVLNLSQSVISHALADMKKVGLVKSQRCGHLICYSLVKKYEKNRFFQLFDKFLKRR